MVSTAATTFSSSSTPASPGVHTTIGLRTPDVLGY